MMKHRIAKMQHATWRKVRCDTYIFSFWYLYATNLDKSLIFISHTIPVRCRLSMLCIITYHTIKSVRRRDIIKTTSMSIRKRKFTFRPLSVLNFRIGVGKGKSDSLPMSRRTKLGGQSSPVRKSIFAFGCGALAIIPRSYP